MSDELIDKEKAFIVETIRLIFRAGLVKGELEGHAAAVAMAQSIIEKLSPVIDLGSLIDSS